MDDSHQLKSVVKVVAVIERVFTQERGAVYGKPTAVDSKEWRQFLVLTKGARSLIQKFHSSCEVRENDLVHPITFPGYDTYLSKIMEIFNDVEILIQSAMS